MNECIEVHWTAGTIDEARKLSRELLQKKLVACCQIIPWIESAYWWNGELETAQESKVVFKTHKACLDSIVSFLEHNASYETPEITHFAIDSCNSSYREFLEQSIIQP